MNPKRFSGWLFSWRIIRRTLIALVALITIVALIWTEENWRGKRAWENFKRQWEAKGEWFDLAHAMPAPVPDDQNFFMAPIWAGVLNLTWDHVNGWKPKDTNIVDRLEMQTWVPVRDVNEQPRSGGWDQGDFVDLTKWQEYYRAVAARTNLFPVPPQPQSPAADVLLALSKYDAAIEELRMASRRPYAQYPYANSSNGYLVNIPAHLSKLRDCASVLQLRAVAQLNLDQTDNALADVELMLHLSHSLRDETFLISHLVRLALVNTLMQPVWEGVAAHKWSDAQLIQISRMLGREDYLSDYGRVMRGERAVGNAIMAQYRSGEPGGPKMPAWLCYQNQLAINRAYQHALLPAVDPSERRVYPEKCSTNSISAAVGKASFYNSMARMLVSALNKGAIRFAAIQTRLDQAVVVCALERYRLARGGYPERLELLQPEFMDTIPHDIFGGQELKYRRTPDAFELYSVGWNGRDDGGKVAAGKGRRIDSSEGDWVWPAHPSDFASREAAKQRRTPEIHTP